MYPAGLPKPQEGLLALGGRRRVHKDQVCEDPREVMPCMRSSTTGRAARTGKRYPTGASTPGHHRPATEHHIWVLSGGATIGGQHVETGSYVHVPPGIDH